MQQWVWSSKVVEWWGSVVVVMELWEQGQWSGSCEAEGVGGGVEQGGAMQQWVWSSKVVEWWGRVVEWWGEKKKNGGGGKGVLCKKQ